MKNVRTQGDPNLPTIIIQQPSRKVLLILLLIALLISLMINLAVLGSFAEYAIDSDGPTEKYRSGEMFADSKIARISVGFTIMQPYTSRLNETIEHVRDDDSVKGVLLVIDSPGGLVSDSHEIYHKLQQLAEKKPIFVQMKGIAASGGYYVAMGAGPEAPIYAEPTTWTGSIGVIIPRYNATELATKVGVASESLATGPLKDTMNPFKELSPQERDVWNEIIDDSFQRFLDVIDQGRANLSAEQIRALATGQVYTASQAVENGLVDEISFEEETEKALVAKLGLTEYQVVEYEHPISLAETLLGVSAPARKTSAEIVTNVMQTATPRAMYLFGWPYGLQSGNQM